MATVNSATTVRSELLGALAVVGIATGLLLLPVVHFIAGPFGPAIGAFVVAQRIRPGGRGVAIVAVGAGAGFGVVVALASLALVAFTVTGSPMEDTSKGWRSVVGRPDFALLAGSIAFVWGALLAAAGAAIGAATAPGETQGES